MASLNGVIQQIADDVDASFDFMFKERLADDIIAARALLIRREYDKYKRYPSYSIYEVSLSITDEQACGVCTGAKVTETYPSVIAVRDSLDFTYVGTTTRKEAISHILPEEIGIFQDNKISGKMPRYTTIGKKIYLFNVATEKVLARGAFVDPRLLAKYKCSNGSACFDPDADGFIEEHLIPTIKSIILQELGGIKPDNKEVQINGEQNVQNQRHLRFIPPTRRD